LRIRHSNRTKALDILDQFHIVAKLNRTLDQVRADQMRRMRQDGQESVLRKALWCLLNPEKNKPSGAIAASSVPSATSSRRPSKTTFATKDKYALHDHPKGCRLVRTYGYQ
jgi:transposase